MRPTHIHAPEEVQEQQHQMRLSSPVAGAADRRDIPGKQKKITQKDNKTDEGEGRRETSKQAVLAARTVDRAA